MLALSRNIVYLVDEIKVSLPMLNKLKNYVGGASASTTTERSPYGHFAVCRRVHASWVATTNEQVFLPDSTGDRRFVVLPIIERGKDYKSINQERAFAQAYYLATHPKAFPLGITTEETEKLKEINQKYVQQDGSPAHRPAATEGRRAGTGRYDRRDHRLADVAQRTKPRLHTYKSRHRHEETRLRSHQDERRKTVSRSPSLPGRPDAGR